MTLSDPITDLKGVGEKRAALLKDLRLPGHMSTNALLQALNLRFTRAEFLARFEKTEEEP